MYATCKGTGIHPTWVKDLRQHCIPIASKTYRILDRDWFSIDGRGGVGAGAGAGGGLFDRLKGIDCKIVH